MYTPTEEEVADFLAVVEEIKRKRAMMTKEEL